MDLMLATTERDSINVGQLFRGMRWSFLSHPFMVRKSLNSFATCIRNWMNCGFTRFFLFGGKLGDKHLSILPTREHLLQNRFGQGLSQTCDTDGVCQPCPPAHGFQVIRCDLHIRDCELISAHRNILRILFFHAFCAASSSPCMRCAKGIQFVLRELSSRHHEIVEPRFAGSADDEIPNFNSQLENVGRIHLQALHLTHHVDATISIFDCAQHDPAK